MRTRAEITPKVGVAHNISRAQCSITYPKHPPTVNPGSAPVLCSVPVTFVYKTLRELSGSRCCCVSVPFAAQKSEPPPPPSLLSLVRARRPETVAAAVAVVVSCPCPAAAVAVVACIRSSPPRSRSRRRRCCHGLVSMPCAAQKPEPPLLSHVRPCPPSREEMETQRPPPLPPASSRGISQKLVPLAEYSQMTRHFVYG